MFFADKSLDDIVNEIEERRKTTRKKSESTGCFSSFPPFFQAKAHPAMHALHRRIPPRFLFFHQELVSPPEDVLACR